MFTRRFQEKKSSLGPAAIYAKNPPRSGDQRRRLLRHHVPVALVSVGALVLFMTLPVFDRGPNHEGSGDAMGAMPGMESPAPTPGGGAQAGPSGHDGDGDGTSGHGGDQGGSSSHGGAQPAPTDHAGSSAGASEHGGDSGSTEPEEGIQSTDDRSFVRRFTTATGYVATGLLAVTLLIGPVNLLLRRRNPVSSYLRRDVGAWTAIFSVVHVFFGFQVHALLGDFLTYFFAPDGRPLTDSFGLGNWTGLGATVIVVGLLAISSNFALRKLTARPWKRLQRLNYALFALVVAHAIFYGALSRVTSPFTLLLVVCVIAVFVGQTVGIWLWRRRLARVATT
jgi:methionine sulfoxide reductase heme-binding subunit